jgi:hypothetical protein
MAMSEITKKRIRINLLLHVIRFTDFALLAEKKPDP